MARKGQVEFIVIFALLIIGAIAAYVALQNVSIQPPAPPGIADEVKTVKDSVTNLIIAGITDRMKTLYANGGEMNPTTGNSIQFGPDNVRVWSSCVEFDPPSIRMELEQGIENYIKFVLQDQDEFFGKDVDFDLARLNVDINILQDRMDVSVTLPTEMEDYSIPQPYTVSYPTKLYDIMGFVYDFSLHLNESNFFEWATIDSIYNSDPDSPYWMPMMNFNVDCGTVVKKTRSELLEGMRRMIKAVVMSTTWNEVPVYFDDPVYALGEVNGKMYPNINLYYVYPESWDLDSNFAVFPPSPIIVEPKRLIPFVDSCVVPITVFYTVKYPIVFSVEDSSTGQLFNFATMACIQNNYPSTGEMTVVGDPEYDQECVQEANCHYRINVTDSDGNPVEGADILFDICDFDRTDSSGISEGNGPCLSLGQLNVYASGFMTYGEVVGIGALASKNITLVKTSGEVNIHFYGVETVPSGYLGEGKYSSYSATGSAGKLSEFGEYNAFIQFDPISPNRYSGQEYPIMTNNYGSNGYEDDITVSGFYPKEFQVSGQITDNSTYYTSGMFNSTFTFAEGTGDIYVYFPVVTGLTESLNDTEITALTDAVRACGFAMVSSGKQELSC